MEKNEVIRRINAARKKIETDGFIYFIDSYPFRENGLFRARPDGSELFKISAKTCKSFEIKDGLIYTVEEYSELDETGYLYDRYRDNTVYRIDGEESITVKRTRGYLGSSD